MKTSMVGLTTMALLCAGAASAESISQVYYRQCLALASSEYVECGRMTGAWRRCHHQQEHDKNDCWASFMQMGQYDPYYGGYPPRFEPVPIPQRPVYILPGMR